MEKGPSLAEILKARYAQARGRFLELLEATPEADLAWQPTPTAHSIAFQFWHAARDTDLFQSLVAAALPERREQVGAGRQVWDEERLAARWGFDPAGLGPMQTGSGMGDAAAAALRFPGKSALAEYARRVVAVTGRVIDPLTDEELITRAIALEAERWTLGAALLENLIHIEWSIGAIAALRRARNLPRVHY